MRRQAWWLRPMGALPLRMLYALARLIGWITYRFVRHREAVVRENLTIAFPQADEATLQDIMRRYYTNFAQVLVEIVKASSWPASKMREHVQIVNLEEVRGLLAQGTPVLIVAAHQCNWEWFLLALAA